MTDTGNRSLAKSDRLLSASDFSRLRTGSRVQKLSHCMVISQKNSLMHARLGLAVSKRSGNAVRRNFLKRTSREIFRLWEFRHMPFDVMVIPSPRIKPLSRDEAGELLRANLKQALLTLSR